ncbi:MAG: hypothetical protein QE263_00215 [Vampirovibrionales bacterium]|nr:hypothetical protein [Vampirovibrionales bacterium]
MPDLTLYQLLLTQLPEPPDLTCVQQRQPLPEHWPVVLKAFDMRRGAMESFTITDGKTEVICLSRVPDVVARLATMEIGTVLHILGGEIRHSEMYKTYVVDVQDICSLKDYDALLKQRERETRRKTEKHQAWLEETYGDYDPNETSHETVVS